MITPRIALPTLTAQGARHVMARAEGALQWHAPRHTHRIQSEKPFERGTSREQV